MVSNIPKMSQAERLERAKEKADAVLSFLASGEVYTTPAVAALLLGVHQTRALACLKSLEKQGFLKSEELYFDARHQKIYGVTAHGQAAINTFTGAVFEKGKTNPQYIHHRLFGQRMRIRAELAGWTAWKHENEIRKEQAALKPDDKVYRGGLLWRRVGLDILHRGRSLLFSRRGTRIGPARCRRRRPPLRTDWPCRRLTSTLCGGEAREACRGCSSR